MTHHLQKHFVPQRRERLLDLSKHRADGAAPALPDGDSEQGSGFLVRTTECDESGDPRSSESHPLA
jgi:hypothetical protein